ncbi:hypothetical protein DAPPUDRAFT_122336 [Daphnia pulex]|uniref:Uncharacterized protein n=1 Tax=Daphnia pulex TaxID=6669 RepID=E9I3Z5_DAPPU|nr:hypothetical protein DAPPUDRAFT_122336 [Daphnia pulex]|eukprot:EFX61284.1 hypothetical protein DAPPUDRAFT_122336 [Daphnia pulex]
MFADGKSLWESLAAIRSTPVSPTLPAPRELSTRQSQAAFVQAASPNTRASSLRIGQPVRALIGRRWLHGKVHSVFPEPQSYVVRLDDGHYFRRTRWAINVDRGTQSQPRSRDSTAMFSYRVPTIVQSAQSATGCETSGPASGVAGSPVIEAPTPVRVGVPSSAEPATPSGRQSSNIGRVRTAASHGARQVRLFDAPLSPSVAPPPMSAGPSGDSGAAPAREPFGTTRSGVRFGIAMPSTRK